MTISETLADAFNRNWMIYQDALQNIPDEHWRTGEVQYLTPARIVYHVLESVDFFSNSKPDGFTWGHRFNIDWENASQEQLPTKEQATTYLNEMIKKSSDWLQKLTDSDLLSPEKAFS